MTGTVLYGHNTNIFPKEEGHMIKRILAAFGLVAVFMFAPVPSANAGTFNDVTHASDDSGKNGPFGIRCNDGRYGTLYKGQSSPPQCGFHVGAIYVGSDRNIKCLNLLPPFGWRTFKSTGWHYVSTATSLKCYVQAN